MNKNELTICLPTMTQKNKTRLEELLKTFSSQFAIHEFHSEWNTFLETLSKNERTVAVQALMNTIVENAKAFRQQAVAFTENGTEEDRQDVLKMVDDLLEHPLFMKESREVS